MTFGATVGNAVGDALRGVQQAAVQGAQQAPAGAMHIVVPFLADEAGSLRPGAPRRSPTRRGAIALADRLAPFCEGVLVLRDDAARGLVCVIGDVPGDVVRRLAA